MTGTVILQAAETSQDTSLRQNKLDGPEVFLSR